MYKVCDVNILVPILRLSAVHSAKAFPKRFSEKYSADRPVRREKFRPEMTQPHGAVVILRRAAACQKEDFFPPTRGGFGGRQDKKRVFEKRMSI